jgi:hypothetical protein
MPMHSKVLLLVTVGKECGAMTFKNEDMKRKMKENFGPDPKIDGFDFGAIAEYALFRFLGMTLSTD